ncbi:type I addiction module toxin, SymE family [Xanthomonas arboricola pv. juglandis]|uniref:SymE family type I addiction module toxin n=1 Tax=Xanthomonas sp. CPBF 426 TaxID=2750648 RepID=UPI000E9849D4|nr:SymE family type I addiction module toxin [Xanthomonas sp. CPBF 426]SYZ57437.1 type I addiction module toxin, SymE family [Xanthomonas arboricola pv. juglandis]
MTHPKATAHARPASPAKRSVVARTGSRQSSVSAVTDMESAADPSPAPTPPLRKPGFRIPERVTMSCQHYDVRRAEDVVGCAVPKLRLSGRWLEHCGFAVGDALQVTVGRGVLLISRVAPALAAVKPRLK